VILRGTVVIASGFTVWLGAGCRQAIQTQAKPVLEEKRAEASDGSLELTIPIPVNSAGWRHIFYGVPKGWHLPVLLTNKSTQPINVWEPTNSWGYDALSLEVTPTNSNGPAQSFKHREIMAWTANAPMFSVLKPGESIVFDVDPGDPHWEGVKWGPGDRYRIRAIYSVEPTQESNKIGVWTGRIASETNEYMLFSGRSVVDSRHSTFHPQFSMIESRYLRCQCPR